MKKETLEKCYAVVDEIRKDPRVIALLEAEKKMNEDENVIKLAYAKDVAASNFSDVLKHCKEDSDEAKTAQKELFIAKKNLDENPLVRDYYHKYQEVRLLYERINDLLIKPFQDSSQEHDCENHCR